MCSNFAMTTVRHGVFTSHTAAIEEKANKNGLVFRHLAHIYLMYT